MDYIRELSLYKRLRVYRNVAPVFSYLLAIIFAFLLADAYGVVASFSYAIYSLLAAFFILSLQYEMKFFRVGFFFLLCLLYYEYRSDSSAESLPTVYMDLDIKVDGINTTNERYTSGYASIINGYNYNDILEDKELFFVIYKVEDSIDIGARLKVSALLKPVDEELSAFDSFLARRKISYKITANYNKVEVLQSSAFSQTLQDIRTYVLDNIENSSPENAEYLALYRALMIGDMSKVAKADKDKFAKSASIHIFAISGLHVGLVASLLYLIFGACGLRYGVSIVFTLLALYVYVQVCGAKPSAMRAYMMISFVALAYVFRRKANSFNALLLSAGCALLYEPKNLFNIGFLLSYCVVACIILYGLALYDYLSKKYKPYAMIPDKFLKFYQAGLRRFYAYLLMSFCISFSAFLGGGFLCSYFFGYVAWSSIINFIIFIPLVSVILVLGFVSLFLPSGLSFYVNNFILFLLKIMSAIAEFFSDSKFYVNTKIGSAYILIAGVFVLLASLIYLKDKRDLRLLYVPISIFISVLILGEICI